MHWRMNDLLKLEIYNKKNKKQEEWPKKEKGLKKWLICGWFTNTCKFGGNSNGKKILNHKHWFNF